MKRNIIFLLGLVFYLSSINLLRAASEDEWLVDEAVKVNKIYQTPYENEPWQFISRTINGRPYTIYRQNHNLSHAVGKAFLLEHIVKELRSNPAGNSALASWLQAKKPEEMRAFMRKLKLSALYHRAGRENENSRTGGTEFEKERFDKNMRNGAEMFQKAAVEQMLDGKKLFVDQKDIDTFKIPYYRYEYQAKGIPMPGDAKYVDSLLYAAHILDVKRVNAAWNDPNKTPNVKPDRMRQLMETLDFGRIDSPIARRLDDISTINLSTRGDRDLWQNRIIWSDEFILQNSDPARMVSKLRAALGEAPSW